MKLPTHKYYSLEKAASLAGCEVSDLIHFAAIGVLEICMKIPEIELFFSYPKEEGAEPVLLKVESSSTLAINEVTLTEEMAVDLANYRAKRQNLAEAEVDGESLEDFQRWLRFSYSSDYFSVTERYNVRKREKEVEKWSGLLAIPSLFIEHNERELTEWDDWEVSVCDFNVPRCDDWRSTPDYEVYDFYTDGWYEVSRKNMYITAYEFNLLINGGEHIYEVPSSASKRNQPSPDVDLSSVNKRAERHAINREGLLRAAIQILSKYPEECRGERKEISPEKWRDSIFRHKNEIPPLIITNEEVILRQLRTAVNGKGNS
ncbi:hypothetical protein ABEG70_01445 [Pantoea agglomerans]|uniref:hypothetical protein n=1 Tax=Enterobacter agglomerans TaxID=549 RepID=UPI0032080BF8